MPRSESSVVQRRNRRVERYEERKLDAKCCDCAADLLEDEGLRCATCADRDEAAKAVYRTSQAGRRTIAKNRKRYAKANARRGLCTRCPRKRAPHSKICTKCRATMTKAQANYRARKAAGVIVLATEKRRRARAAAIARHAEISGRCYVPIDEQGTTRTALLRIMRHLDWSTSSEILELLGVPPYEQGDRRERDAFAQMLCRLAKAGIVERRSINVYRKHKTHEYRLKAAA